MPTIRFRCDHCGTPFDAGATTVWIQARVVCDACWREWREAWAAALGGSRLDARGSQAVGGAQHEPPDMVSPPR